MNKKFPNVNIYDFSEVDTFFSFFKETFINQMCTDFIELYRYRIHFYKILTLVPFFLVSFKLNCEQRQEHMM